jgi:hypothetical protein
MEIPMTAEQFAALQKRAGIPADHVSGMAEEKGVTAHWYYANGVLTGTILKKPWLMPEALVWYAFRKWAGITAAT